jgi:hypothetical protein
MYIYIYIHIYTYKYVCIYVYIYMHIYVKRVLGYQGHRAVEVSLCVYGINIHVCVCWVIDLYVYRYLDISIL